MSIIGNPNLSESIIQYAMIIPDDRTILIRNALQRRTVMVGGIILSIIPCLMFTVSRFGLKDFAYYEEKARAISGNPDIPLAKKLKNKAELKWYAAIAMLWVIGLCLKWIANW